MWHRARGAKNWMTAMAVLFAVVGVIVIVRDLLLWGPEFVGEFFVNERITNEKIVLVMFGISITLFLFGIRRGVEFYR